MSRLLVMILLIAGVAAAPAAAPAAAAPPASPTVGVEGKIEVALPGTLLQARPVTDKAPLLLRVASTQPAARAEEIRYDLRYIGLVPGAHDLKHYLVRADGSPAADLPAVPVTVAGVLAPDHQGQLVPDAGARWPFFGGYRGMMAGALVAWLALLVPLIRMGRKKRGDAVAEPPPEPPTFADRLRPLIDQAALGELSADDKGRLERMLLWYWRRKLNLGEQGPGEAIMTLRRHHEAGELLRALEQWLHRPPGKQVPATDVALLLEPYRTVPDPDEVEALFAGSHAGARAATPAPAATAAAVAVAAATGAASARGNGDAHRAADDRGATHGAGGNAP